VFNISPDTFQRGFQLKDFIDDNPIHKFIAVPIQTLF
jgi:hypothetical protein